MSENWAINSDSDIESNYGYFDDWAYEDDILFDWNVNFSIEIFLFNVKINARTNNDRGEFISKESCKMKMPTHIVLFLVTRKTWIAIEMHLMKILTFQNITQRQLTLILSYH